MDNPVPVPGPGIFGKVWKRAERYRQKTGKAQGGKPKKETAHPAGITGTGSAQKSRRMDEYAH
jgi:hypothetical protein